MTLPDTTKSTCSPGSEVGPMPSDSPDGPMIAPCGQDLVLASPSRSAETEGPSRTVDTFGPCSPASSESAVLQRSLGNKLQALLGESGSLEFSTTWRTWDMPGREPICALRGSARRTNDSGFTGWRTPMALENNHGSIAFHVRRSHTSKPEAMFRLGDQVVLEFGIPMMSVLGVTGDDTAWRLDPAHVRWLMGFPPEWDACTVTATPSSRKSRRRSSEPTGKP